MHYLCLSSVSILLINSSSLPLSLLEKDNDEEVVKRRFEGRG
jgi:hypothetical protein